MSAIRNRRSTTTLTARQAYALARAYATSDHNALNRHARSVAAVIASAWRRPTGSSRNRVTQRSRRQARTLAALLRRRHKHLHGRTAFPAQRGKRNSPDDSYRRRAARKRCERFGDIPVTRGASCGSVGGALVPERPGRLCIGSRAFLHGALPGGIRWWAGDFGRIGRAGHRRGDVAAFVRRQLSGRCRRGCCSCACYSGVRG